MRTFEEMSHMKDKANAHIANGAYKGFVGCMVSKTIPQLLMNKLPEGVSEMQVAGAVATILEPIVGEKEFLEAAAKSKIYSAVYIAGYLMGIRKEAPNMIAEAQDVKTVEDVVLSIQELMSSKNVTSISNALENKLRKDFVDDNVRYQKERDKENELVSKVDTKIGDKVGSSSPESTSMTSSIDAMFGDDEDVTEPTVETDEDGGEIPVENEDEHSGVEETEEPKTPEEIAEEEELQAEAERLALLDARKPYYTIIFDVVKQHTIKNEHDVTYGKVLSIAAIGLGNFLDQLNVIPMDVYINRLKQVLGYSEPATIVTPGMGMML